MPLVSIIVPCRNEKAYIHQFMECLCRQNLPAGVSLELLIADGMSDDGTRPILAQYAEQYTWVKVISNPARIVSCGLNRAIPLASGEVIIRMDVHARYAPDYVAECLAVLKETRADNVGGPARTEPHGYMQQAISAAYHSRFACGGARFHDTSYEGYVDTVTFGCWKRSLFQKVGGFDEELVRNQDDEHNYRIIRSGGRIYQSPRIQCWYAPRSSLRALFRQYSQYGYWKVRLIRKHGKPAALRHLIPATFVGTLILLALAAPFDTLAARTLEALSALYLLCALIASLTVCGRKQLHLLPVMPVVLATYHVSYGLGFLTALLGRRQRLETMKTPNSGAV